ncbi:MAG: tyrosine-type recombinase/integrase family protein [Bryobacteraceae bacterium]|nr:tyrosine-type recombinase/integrase family protein [Bryobacteraceae bacterium]
MKPYRIQRKGKRYWAMEIPAHYLPPGAGRTVIVATTREEAEARWLRRVAEYRRGLDVNAAKKTLSEFLNEFLDQCRGGDQIERSTYEDYRHHIRTHIEPILGKVTLDRLTTREIDRFLVALKQKVSQRTKRRLAPKTIHYAYGVLRCALQLAVDYDYISFNPASAQSRRSRVRIKANTAPIRCFTPEQSQQFLKAVHQDRYACLYVLAVTTGLRKGELLGLQWADVDLDRSRLTVNDSLQFTRRLKGEDGPR